jgi:hypothetical protein
LCGRSWQLLPWTMSTCSARVGLAALPFLLLELLIPVELASSLRIIRFRETPSTKRCGSSRRRRSVHVRDGSKATVRRCPRHFRFAPESRHSTEESACLKSAISGLMHRTKRVLVRSPRRRKRARAHSGNPAFRRPSINSFALDCPPRAIHADIVKAGSVSSTRAAASRASSSRPRWAKADARQR